MVATVAHDFRVLKKSTLLDIEFLIQSLRQSDTDNVTVWLPRELGSQLFKESRVVAFLATAASRGTLIVRDWIQSRVWNQEQAKARFQRTVEGLASMLYAHAISNATGDALQLPLANLVHTLIETGGILEGRMGYPPEGASAVSLTICALDPEVPEPLVLGGIRFRDQFVAEFIELRNKYLERAFGTGSRAPGNLNTEQALAEFVFELFQNSFEHGRLDEDGRTLTGLRYIRLRKHIHFNQGDFLKRAQGFQELQDYLSSVGTTSKAPTYYEIAVSDHGLGLIKRFLATRKDFAVPEDTRDAQVGFVNTIIDKALSSKINQPGAGYGLRRAIKAVQDLSGFLSLRTDRVWLYKAFGQQVEPQADWQMEPVKLAKLPAIAGTHFNMVFPLR